MMACLASGMAKGRAWIEQAMFSVTQIWLAPLQQAVCWR